MEYTYAALLLEESGEELNERNLKAVLEAGGCSVVESRVKALVAALEGVDMGSVGHTEVGEALTTDEASTESEMPEVAQAASGDGTGTELVETSDTEG